MHTMDFEEFLWANNYKDKDIEKLYEYFKSRKAVPENIHEMYKNLFNQYICVGGFPRTVIEYLDSHNIMNCFRINSNIVFDMKSDFGRRLGKDGQPVFKPSEVARIQNAFDLIPTFLAKENKRYVTSKITGGSSFDKVGAIEYLRQSHIVHKVFNVETPSLPLSGYAISSQFKLFPEDISIITSMYGLETIAAINKGELSQGKGAIYEAVVFDSLNKAGFDVYYFAKESGLEIDFVIAYNTSSTLIEAKARTGNAKSSKTVMTHPKHYGPAKLIKIGAYNIGETGDKLTIPHYLVFMLGKQIEYYN